MDATICQWLLKLFMGLRPSGLTELSSRHQLDDFSVEGVHFFWGGGVGGGGWCGWV